MAIRSFQPSADQLRLAIGYRVLTLTFFIALHASLYPSAFNVTATLMSASLKAFAGACQTHHDRLSEACCTFSQQGPLARGPTSRHGQGHAPFEGAYNRATSSVGADLGSRAAPPEGSRGYREAEPRAEWAQDTCRPYSEMIPDAIEVRLKPKERAVLESRLPRHPRFGAINTPRYGLLSCRPANFLR